MLPENLYIKKTLETLFLHKAEDVVLVDLRKFKTLLDDYLIICTSQSEVQMRALLKKCESRLRTEGLKPIKVEYSPGVKWGILKSAEFILHVFEKETRDYYSLERLWGDANMIQVNQETFLESVETKEDLPSSPDKEDSSHEFL